MYLLDHGTLKTIDAIRSLMIPTEAPCTPPAQPGCCPASKGHPTTCQRHCAWQQKRSTAHPEHLEEVGGVADGDVGDRELAVDQKLAPVGQRRLQHVESLQRTASQHEAYMSTRRAPWQAVAALNQTMCILPNL